MVKNREFLKFWLSNLFLAFKNFDSNDFEQSQAFFNSSDGTRVPLFIVKHKSIKDPAPCLMTAYGSHGISKTPSFRLSTEYFLNKFWNFVF